MPGIKILLSDFFQSFRILCLKQIYPLKGRETSPGYVRGGYTTCNAWNRKQNTRDNLIIKWGFFLSLNVSSVFSIQNIIHASQKTLIQSSSCLFCYAYCFLFVCNMSAPSQAKFDFLTSHALHASHARAVLGRVRLCGVFACVKLCFEAWDNTLLTMIMNPAVVIKHVLIGKKYFLLIVYRCFIKQNWFIEK